MSKENPRVFISYAHENDAHVQAVSDLAEWLLQKGVQPITDIPYSQAAKAPRLGWQIWMLQEIEDCDMVLVICSPEYKKRFEKREPDTHTGAGVVYEGAVITQILYNNHLNNTKMIVVVPDAHTNATIPLILQSHYAGLKFPSGYDKIFTAIVTEINIPRPRGTVNKQIPAQLKGYFDRRLSPAQGKLYGRTAEVEEVLRFLKSDEDSAVVSALLTGTAGIGKTEICKAALALYMKEEAREKCFYIKIPDTVSPQLFIERLANDLNLGEIEHIEQLLPLLPPGLYYLDNIESLGESPEALGYLRQIRDKNNIRILASSRSELSLLGRPIHVDALPPDVAVQLFIDKWEDKTPLTNNEEVRQFVVEELGCHALTIILIARRGYNYPFPRLKERWQQAGILLASKAEGEEDPRLTSLHRSLLLSADVLEKYPGCLTAWIIAALFPEGLPEILAATFAKNNFFTEEALAELMNNHILERNGELYTLLPPLARFALDEAVNERNGFSWKQARAMMYLFFIAITEEARSLVSSEEALNAKRFLLNLFDTLYLFLTKELQYREPDIDRLTILNDHLYNLYKFRASLSAELLPQIIASINNLSEKAYSIKALGDLEYILGRPEAARQYYEAATGLFKQEQDNLGLANTLRSLGDLERQLGNPEAARQHYETATDLYKQEQNNLGLANTLQSLGDLERQLGNPDAARQHYETATGLFKEVNDNLGLANTIKSLGDLERQLGNPDAARHHYETAAGLYKQEQENLGLANTIKSLGDLERQLGNPDAARQHYETATGLYKLEQNNLGLANTLRSLGDLERQLGNPDAARQHYETATGLYKQEQNNLGLANTLQSLGDLEKSASEYADAVGYYETAADLYEKEQTPAGLAYTFAELCICFHHQGRLPEKQAAACAAIAAATRANNEQVVKYVAQCFYQTEGSEEGVKNLIAGCEGLE